tara:strand:+ start:835 stop:969 length:135 start_codon:yes stop_codon:yes gene_type:complete
MLDFIKDSIQAFTEKPVDSIISFLFIAGVFYLLYFSLWVFCPCG